MVKNLPAMQETQVQSLGQENPLEKGMVIHSNSIYMSGFPGGSVVKNLPTMQETQVRSQGQENPLEKGMATHSSIPAWRIPWTEEPGGLHTVHGVSQN